MPMEINGKSNPFPAFTCNRCKRFFDERDFTEVQEALHWKNFAGYGSIFGDGNIVSIDLCQDCVIEVLGEWVKQEGTYF